MRYVFFMSLFKNKKIYCLTGIIETMIKNRAY